VTDKRFLLATRSQGKLAEMRAIFAEYGLQVIDLAELGIPETDEEDHLEQFDTFEDNALAKARYFFELSGGRPTFADDSGMCVDALSGEPGVYSKRWSGHADPDPRAVDAANNAKLVTRMNEARAAMGKSFTDTARYVAVAVYKDDVGEVLRRGEIEGRVLAAPRGKGGFGYDPYFEAPDLGGTFAESPLERTAATSHRSRAFRALLGALRDSGRV
jgi:XTP/dITP diphosphohydrolase